MRVALIFNPRSGRGPAKGDLLVDVCAALKRHGMEPTAHATNRPYHATELAREASRAGYDWVFGWGGDGTLNEVAQGLVGTETPMAVLPGGTVNVLAREMRLSRRLERAIDDMAGGRPTRVPLGIADERVFLLMAGVGLDGEVVYRLKAGFKDALGAYAFWLDGFRLLASYPFTPIVAESNGRTIEGTGLIAGKLRRYGPHYFVTPDARLEEPMLDVVVFQGRKKRDYLRYLFGVIGRFHLRFRDIVHLKTDVLRVETEGVRIQLDGEPAGRAPVSLGVRDDALTLVLPSK